MRSLQTALHALQTPHKKSLFSRNGFSSFNYSQKQKTVNGTQFKMKKGKSHDFHNSSNLKSKSL